MWYPFIMEPYYKNYIWGGRNLEKLGKSLPDGDVAESWEVSVRAEGESLIANGWLAGKSLAEAIEMYPKCILGESTAAKDNSFPLLFKLIDANEKLSVQVHPDDAYAQKFENEPNGKHEAWYVLDALPDASIVYGLLPSTSKEQLQRLIKQNRIGDCLNTVGVKPGDVINIAPGTIHAIGKGIVLAEIQQNSNMTYRVYDYDRKDALGNPRELHIEKALDVIDYSSPKPFASGIISHRFEDSTIISLLGNEYFQLEALDIHGTMALKTQGDRFYILFVAQGEACIAYDGGTVCVKTGETIFIPAVLSRYAVTGECRLLRMYVPLTDYRDAF